MTFLNPAALLFLLAIPLIVILHMLRPRRRRTVVPSLQFWLGAERVRSQRVRLRPPPPSLSLLLHLLIAAAAALALARPSIYEFGLGTAAPRHLVLLLDASASMQAADAQLPGAEATSQDAPLTTRFEAARRRAEALLNAMAPADRATLVRVSDEVRLVASGSGTPWERGELLQALEGLEVGAAGADFRAAFELARSLAEPTRALEVHVLSDGGFAFPSDAGPLPGRVIFEPIGGSDDNQAITQLRLGRDPLGGRPEGFARVSNFSDQPVSVPLRLFADDIPLEQRQVDLPPRGSVELAFEPPSTTELLELRLGINDALAADNVAWALQSDRLGTVQLVAANGSALERPLSLLPGVTLETIATRDYDPARRADVTVFDGFVPPRLPPNAVLLVNPPAGGPVEVQGSPRPVRVARVDPRSPLLAGVELEDELLGTAAPVARPPWARVAAEADDGAPLILEGQRDGRRIVVWAFDPRQSRLPTKLTFPLLVYNTLAALADPASSERVVAGSPVTLAMPAEATELIAHTPRGTEQVPFQPGAPVLYDRTTTLGPYVLEVRDARGQVSQHRFVVDLFDENESDIAPRPQALADLVTVPPAAAGHPVGVEAAPFLVIGALVLLFLEWLHFLWRR